MDDAPGRQVHEGVPGTFQEAPLSFRERSENTDLIVEITLQPWRAFPPGGVILLSDVLTPLDAMGIPFEIDKNKGPIINSVIRTDDKGLRTPSTISTSRSSASWGSRSGLNRKEVGVLRVPLAVKRALSVLSNREVDSFIR